jgi:hypothetical protein
MTPKLVRSRAEPAVYHPVPNARDSRSMHTMVTCRAAWITKPEDRLQLSVADSSPLFPVLSSVRSVLVKLHLRHAMEEYKALLSNNTWDLVPRSSSANVVTGKWIFMHKFMADGSLDRYKAHCVLLVFTQHPGVGDDETYNPVVKPATVSTLAPSRG